MFFSFICLINYFNLEPPLVSSSLSPPLPLYFNLPPLIVFKFKVNLEFCDRHKFSERKVKLKPLPLSKQGCDNLNRFSKFSKFFGPKEPP